MREDGRRHGLARCHEEHLRSALEYVPPAGYDEAFWRSQEQILQSV